MHIFLCNTGPVDITPLTSICKQCFRRLWIHATSTQPEDGLVKVCTLVNMGMCTRGPVFPPDLSWHISLSGIITAD